MSVRPINYQWYFVVYLFVLGFITSLSVLGFIAYLFCARFLHGRVSMLMWSGIRLHLGIL